MILNSKLPDVCIPEDVDIFSFLLDDRLRQSVDYYHDAVCMFDMHTGRSFTYRELKHNSKLLCTNLWKLGFRHQDCLCLFLPNVIEYPTIILGILKFGGIATTANPLYTPVELNHQLRSSGAKAVFTISMFEQTVREAARNTQVKDIILLDMMPGSKGSKSAGTIPYYKLMMGTTGDMPYVKINAKKDVSIMCYSSGTTGPPKGVVHTHYSIIANMIQTRAADSGIITGRQTLLALLPFFHIYGLAIVCLLGIHSRSKMVALMKFEPELFLGAIQDHKVTNLLLVPPLVLFMAKHPMVSEYDLSSVKTVGSGAAPLGTDLSDEFCKRCGFDEVVQGFGMTECIVTHFPAPPIRTGSVGCLVPNTQAKVIDVSNGRLLGPDEDGEICIRGPQVMVGYLNLPKATAQTIDRDGWLHTGDIGHFDEDGYFYIVDRLKELIKYKGFQVAPAELEDLLISHPQVSDVAVIGVPDDRAGEVPRAYLVRNDDSLTERDIHNYLAGKVSDYKRLRGGVIFIDEIPKSQSGKILRRKLRDQAKNDVQAKL